MTGMMADVSRVLIGREDIAVKVREIGEKLSKEYGELKPVLICVLKGSTIFYADLVRQMDIPMRMDFIAASSYGRGTGSSGEVRLLKDLDESIEGRHVVVVEDILDTGLTLHYLTDMLRSRKPASLKICALLDKPERRKVKIEADWKGFEIPNEFVVGYGLDFAEQYRNLPDICVLKPEVYQK